MKNGTSINLLSRVQRAHRANRRFTRLWIAIVLMYGSAVLSLWSTDSIWGDAELITQQTRLKNTADESQGEMQSISAMQKQLVRLNTQLNLTRSITERPDWSILLSAIARPLEKNLTLREVRVDPLPVQPNGNDSGLLQMNAARVNVSGVARTQQDVSAYTLALQSLPIFDKVEMIHTDRTTNGNASSVSFELQCHIGEVGNP